MISTIRTHEADGEYTRYPTSLCPNRGQERDEVELNVPESVTRPGTWAQRLREHDGPHVDPARHTDLFLTLALHGGSVEIGSRASERQRITTKALAGHGAIRETVEPILKSKGIWDAMIDKARA